MKLFSTVKRPLASAALLGLACLATTPAGAADGKGTAYVTNQNGDITVIDLATLETISEIDVGAEGPRGLGVTADGTLLVTANGEAGNLSVIDRATGKVLRHIAIGKNPEFVRVRGDYAFVSFEPAAVGGPPPKPGSAEAKSVGRRAREGESGAGQDRGGRPQAGQGHSHDHRRHGNRGHRVLRRRQDDPGHQRGRREHQRARDRDREAGEEDLHQEVRQSAARHQDGAGRQVLRRHPGVRQQAGAARRRLQRGEGR